MGLPKRYDPREAEPRWQKAWQEAGTDHFPRGASGPVYSIDTPPPTISGKLHLGHVFSYSQTDLLARFHRMRGERVYYPMGFDDNGLPTERLVEATLGKRAVEEDRDWFIAQCRRISDEAREEYEALFRRLGLSVDWRYGYRTSSDEAQRASQLSFLDLLAKGRVYRKRAPTLWCPECRTALAQADLNDLERATTFHTLAFARQDGTTLPIATTRPELLPACVAVLVHPDDPRFADLAGQEVGIPLFNRSVPVRTDPQADPQKGTGAVMVCTFGDATDLEWWRAHDLPLIEILNPDGTLAAAAGEFGGLSLSDARERIGRALEERGLLLERRPSAQSVRVHERCDTPVEYIVTRQWFVRVLDRKAELLAAADRVRWHPDSMKLRFRQWVENLAWDWCVSRQRIYGVPIPAWTCMDCGELVPAEEARLPVDPRRDPPPRACACGSRRLQGETDLLDTWATSSLTPQIAGRRLEDPELYAQVFPFSLRPQAHEIIRTWAFYTLYKSWEHFAAVPWREIAISGWALAPAGSGKISKSRGGGPRPPLEMIDRTSADAVRYWAASSGLGKDTWISEEKIALGERLVTKLWNVARFAEPFLRGIDHRAADRDGGDAVALSPADRWILARARRLVERATALWERCEHATALQETETFFWSDLADNYLEMAKVPLYAAPGPEREGARLALYTALRTAVKLLAPVLPHVTEEIHQALFADADGCASVHRSSWPDPSEIPPAARTAGSPPAIDAGTDGAATPIRRTDGESAGGIDPERAGEELVAIATAVRRYKSEHGLALGSALAILQIACADPAWAALMTAAANNLRSVTRAVRVEVVQELDRGLDRLESAGSIGVAIGRV